MRKDWRLNPKMILEEMEPRQLFSGGLEGVLLNDSIQQTAIYQDIDANTTPVAVLASSANLNTQAVALAPNDASTLNPPTNNAPAAQPIQLVDASGDVLSFAENSVTVASSDHLLQVNLVGTNPVTPVSNGAVAADAAIGTASTFNEVSYAGLWDGVTLNYTAQSGAILESSYTINADMAGNPVNQIQLQYNAPVSIDNQGNLVVSFANGVMTDSAPIAYQIIDGQKVSVDVSYTLTANNQVGFVLGNYDHSQQLVIDPTLTWTTFLGGSGSDTAYAMTVDSSGNVYVVGYSSATWGSPVRAFAGGSNDVFVAKLDSSGNLLWNTFLGGSGNDQGYAIAEDGSGNVFVSGSSTATWGAPLQAFGGGTDAFVAKLNSSGSLTWNTFLGGAGHETAYGITVDGSGNLYISGSDDMSWGSPVRAFSGSSSVFVAKLSSSGAFNWNTFLGGNGTNDNNGILVDSNGNIDVAGISSTTWGSPERAFGGGGNDGFVAQLNNSGSLLWNTFLGGNGVDGANWITSDNIGNIYVSGDSSATWGSPVRAFTGNTDGFVTKLNNSGTLVWNTFLGGSGVDDGYGIAVDGSGNVYVTGDSAATWGSPLQVFSGGTDAFAAELNASGSLTWNTFLGGGGTDSGYAIATFGSNNVYVAGISSSAWGTPVRAYSSNQDAFVALIGNGAPVVNTTGSTLSYVENNPATIIDSGLTVTDIGSPNLVGATVTISTGFVSGQDVLGFTNQNGITGSWNSTTGVLTLTGSATIANYQTALCSITYLNTSQTPSTATRTVFFVASDGTANSTAAKDYISVSAVDNAPVINLSTNQIVNGDFLLGSTNWTNSGDGFFGSNYYGWTTDYASGTLTYSPLLTGLNSGPAPSGAAQVVAQVQWNNGNPDNNNTRNLNISIGGVVYATFTTGGNQGTNSTITFSNGATGSPASSLVGSATVTINLPANVAASGNLIFSATYGTGAGSVDDLYLNSVQVLTTPFLAYTENNPAMVIDSALTITDVDSTNLVGATVSISSGFVSGQDTLAFTNKNGITGSWNANTGVMTLSGSATVANYQTALSSITYVNTSDNPSTAARTISFSVNDGTLNSATQNRNITVTAVDDPPVVITSSSTLTYLANAAPMIVDNALTLSDVDNTTLSGVTVSISSGFVTGQDILGFINQNGITGNWNTSTGVFSLTGSATVANYQAALRSITYVNTASSPNTAARVVSFVANDGVLNSAVANRNIAVTTAVTAPINIAPSGQYLAFNTTQVFSSANANQISISDTSVGTNLIQITLSAGHGTLMLQTTAGLTFSSGSNGSAAMTLTGTLSNINAALNGLSYNATSNYRGFDQLQIVTNDLGNNGTGIPLGVSSTVNLHVGAMVVTNNNDLGNGNTASVSALAASDGGDGISLREAILAVNNTPGADYIYFNIPGTGVQTINLTSALPAITSQVTIDATTDPSFVANGSHPAVVLNGNNVVQNGLELYAGSDGSTVRGLIIQNFVSDGIDIATSNGNTIAGNWIGLNANGTAAAGNQLGVNIWDSSNTLIGGNTAADRNVISGNTGGIYLGIGATNNQISGNYIGTNATGDLAVGNQNQGVYIDGSNNTIGGTTAGSGNVISGSLNYSGITLSASASNTLVVGNLIGLNAAGTAALGNATEGIDIFSSNNTIGGSTPNARNVISGNGGIGVLMGAGAINNQLSGNYIGTNATGDVAIGNQNHGVYIESSGNIIGGTTAGSGNVISGTLKYAEITLGVNASNTLMAGNLIGLNAAGTAALDNVCDGIDIFSSNNIIGGSTPSARNVISGNVGYGILVTGGVTNNQISGNYLGTNAAGDAAVGNQHQNIYMDAAGNTVGGTTAGSGNVISGTLSYAGLTLSASASNTLVAGNTIGLNAAGTAALGNADSGIEIFSSNNIIGGSAANARNVISGNNGSGINIGINGGPASGNLIQGNYIGVNTAGNGALANLGNGVTLQTSGNTVGGTTAAAANIISGNTSAGVEITGSPATGNTVAGNYIGLNAAGTSALANGTEGVVIDRGASYNTVGGVTTASRNIISGNIQFGIDVTGESSAPTNNTIQNNYIGTNATGSAAVSNGGFGVVVDFAAINTTISNNLISGNTNSSESLSQGGIYLFANGATIQGNTIGLDASGTVALGNGGGSGETGGIKVRGGSTNVLIGGTTAGQGNTIANNVGSGVVIHALAGNISVLGNAIYNNTGLGIDLGNDGVTLNSVNGTLNFPVLYNANVSLGNTTITGEINTTANTTLRIEFFVSPLGTEDPTGYGEGKTYLGYADVTTNASGFGSISTTLTGVSLNAGDRVSATATVKTGSNSYATTSEFSMNVPASVSANPINTLPAAQIVPEDTLLAVAGVSVSDPNGDLSTVKLSVNNGMLTVNLAGGANISAGANTSASLTLAGTQAQINAALATLNYQGIAQFNGSDTLTLLSTDSMGGTDSDSVTITVSSVNDAPTLTNGATVTLTSTNEDTPSSGTAVSSILAAASYSDVDTGALGGIAITTTIGSGIWQYSTDGTTWASVGAVSATNALLLNVTSQVRYLPDSANGELASFNFKAWDQTTGSASTNTTPGYASVVSSGGSTAYSTASATASITVSSLNDAPTLGYTGLISFPATNQNTISAATQVSDILVTTLYTDVDASALSGIAVVGFTGSGTFQYSTDNITWSNIGSVSANTALLLNNSSYIRYVSNGISGETATLQVSGWDQTIGTASTNAIPEYANASVNGGTSAFSTQVDTIWQVVTPVNNAPQGSDSSITLNANSSYTFSAANFGFSDTGNSPANNLLNVIISSLPGAGTLSNNGVAVSLGQVISISDINAGKLTYTPAIGGSGNNYASFGFQVQDDGGISNGGSDTDVTPNTLTINVTPLPNQAPQGSDSSITLNANSSYTFSAANFGFSDTGNSPANNLLNVIISSLPSVGTLSNNGAVVSVGQSVSITDINAGKLSFTPAVGVSGNNYASFSFQVQDDGGTANGGSDTDASSNTLTINVTPLPNQAPQGSDSSITLNANSSYTFSAANFGFSDTGNSPANNLLNVIISSLPSVGTLSNNGAVVSVGQSVSITDINAGKLSFTPAVGASGNNYASFSFQVQDDGGTANGGSDTDASPNSLTINVTPLPNQAPQGSDSSITLNANSSYTFSAANFGFSDTGNSPANNLLNVIISSLPGAGSLSNNGVAVSLGQVISISDINTGKLTFTPAVGASGNNYAHFGFQVQDDGGTANGGSDTDASSNTLTINVTPLPNQAPQGSDSSITLNANSSYTFSAANFGFSDTGNSPANNLLNVIISSLPGAGTLSNNGVAVSLGQVISISDINAGKLTFTPAVGASGNNYASFSFQVQDDGGTANGGSDTDASPNSLTINVTPLPNQAPQGSDSSITLNANSSYTFSAANFGFSDSGNSPANNLLNVIISSLPSVGSLQNNGSTVSLGQVISISDINAGKLSYTPVIGASGTHYASFSFQVQDDGGTANGGLDTDATPNTLTINVTPLPNQAPQGSDSSITLNVNSSYTFSATNFGFSDTGNSPANNLLNVIISSLPGAGTLSNNGVAVSLGQSVSITDINAGKLSFTPAAGASGNNYASFGFQVQDDGGTANGGSDTDASPNSLTINITPLPNQAPQGSDSSITLNANSSYTFSAANFGFSDTGNSPANNLLNVIISSLPGAGSLSNNGVAVSLGQVISISDINTGKLTFTPAVGASGNNYAHFGFQVQDDGGISNGGSDTDVTPNTLTINVTPLPNQAPQGSDSSITLNANSSYTFSAANFGFSDSGNSPANNLLNVIISSLPSVGSLQNNGSTVSLGQVISISDINAGKLSYTPVIGASGTHYASFSFQVQDDGGTANGGLDTDATPNTLTINVTPLPNQAPQGSDSSITLNVNSSYTFSATNFGFSDTGNSPANNLLNVIISSLPGAGTLSNNGVAVSLGQSVSITDINAGKLSFTPAAGASGNNYASFGFQVQDDGGTANGGSDTDASPNSLTINITPLPNQAPQGSDSSITLNANSSYTFSAANFGFSDTGNSPANNLLNVIISSLPGAGSLSNNGVAVSLGQVISISDINTGKLTFTPAVGASGNNYAHFGFQVQDDGGISNGGSDTDVTPNTLTINVTPLPNQAPQGSDSSITLNANSSYTFSAANFGFSDTGNSPANNLLNVIISSLPSVGTLSNNGAVVSVGQSVSITDINAGKLSFTPAVGVSGNNYASFSFQVQDDGGTANGGSDTDASSNTLTINVTPLPNQAPQGSDSSITMNANSSYIFSAANFGFSDTGNSPANNLLNVIISSLPGAGTLSNNGVAVSLDQAISVSDINAGKLIYTPVIGGSGNNYASFGFQVQDDGGTANGGSDTDVTPNTLTINVTPLPNQAPQGSDSSITLNANSSYTFSAANFGFSDTGNSPANNLLNVIISSLPGAGTLSNNGVAVSLGQVISISDINAGKLTYTPAIGGSGNNYASFGFQVQDDGGTANGGSDTDVTPNTLTINVTPLPNQAPQGSDSSITLNANSSYTFSAANFGFSDTGNSPANNLLNVIISSLPGAGTLSNNGVAVSLGQAISVSDINAGKLIYTPVIGGSGNNYASFGFQVQDDGGTANGGLDTDASPNTLTINVTPLPNQAPQGRDSSITLNANSSYTFSAANFGFSDTGNSPANNLLNVIISSLPSAGSLSNNGVAVSLGQVINISDINAGKLTFTPAAGASGNNYASFGFQVQDDGGTANGGLDTDASPNTLSINVTPLPNQAPQGSDSSITLNANSSYTFSAANFGFSDTGNSPANNLLNVIISSLPGAGTLSNNGVAVSLGQAISVSDINAGKLSFTPTAGASGNNYASFGFQVQDDGGTANGGLDTDATPNTLTINVTPLPNQTPIVNPDISGNALVPGVVPSHNDGVNTILVNTISNTNQSQSTQNTTVSSNLPASNPAPTTAGGFLSTSAQSSTVSNIQISQSILITAPVTSTGVIKNAVVLNEKAAVSGNYLEKLIESNTSAYKKNIDLSTNVTLAANEANKFGVNTELDYTVDMNDQMTADEEQVLWQKLASMRQTMGESSTQKSIEEIEIYLASTVTLTAGFVSWVLRGGALLTSFLSSIPLFKNFDPLPIVVAANKSSKQLKSEKLGDVSDDHEAKVEQMFSNASQDDLTQ